MERCSGGKDVEVEAAIGEAVAISDQSLEMQSPGYREDVKWEEGVNWTRNADQGRIPAPTLLLRASQFKSRRLVPLLLLPCHPSPSSLPDPVTETVKEFPLAYFAQADRAMSFLTLTRYGVRRCDDENC